MARSLEIRNPVIVEERRRASMVYFFDRIGGVTHLRPSLNRLGEEGAIGELNGE